jgi:hypothetical protein
MDSKYDEVVIEPLSAHNEETINNFDELPFCMSQKGERWDTHKKPEKRDVVDNINPKGGYDNLQGQTRQREDGREDIV